jgi:SAM-dependent methyltransferase
LIGMKPDERVLLTSLAGARLHELAGAVRQGALVGLGAREEVWQARRSCAGFDHVMFVEGSREEIPWAEAWFDVIVDPQPESPTAEMLRVLRPGGRIVSLQGAAVDE